MNDEQRKRFENTLRQLADRVLQRLGEVDRMLDQPIHREDLSRRRLLQSHMDGLASEIALLEPLRKAYTIVLGTEGILALAGAGEDVSGQEPQEPEGGYQ